MSDERSDGCSRRCSVPPRQRLDPPLVDQIVSSASRSFAWGQARLTSSDTRAPTTIDPITARRIGLLLRVSARASAPWTWTSRAGIGVAEDLRRNAHVAITVAFLP